MIKIKNNYKINFDKNISYECYNISPEWEVGTTLTKTEITRLQQEDEEIKIKTKALFYISNKDYSEYELRMKLIRKGFSDKSIEKILKILKNKNLIDEYQVAKNILKFKTINKPEGAYLIKKRLKDKRIQPHIINDIVKEAEKRDEYSLAYSIAEKKFRSLQSKGKLDNFKEKIYYSLQWKGFSITTILKIIEKLKDKNDME